jgi:hypothetical protein
LIPNTFEKSLDEAAAALTVGASVTVLVMVPARPIFGTSVWCGAEAIEAEDLTGIEPGKTGMLGIPKTNGLPGSTPPVGFTGRVYWLSGVSLPVGDTHFCNSLRNTEGLWFMPYGACINESHISTSFSTGKQLKTEVGADGAKGTAGS